MIDASIGMTAPGFDGGGRETGPTEAVNRGAMEAILSASHGDPFAVLGPHEVARGEWDIRVMQPGAHGVDLLDFYDDVLLTSCEQVHPEGFFVGRISADHRPGYRLRVRYPGGERTINDPYLFGSALTDDDIAAIRHSNDTAFYFIFGAHPVTLGGISGHALRGLGAERQERQRRRRLQRVGRALPCHALAPGGRRLGIVRARDRQGGALQIRDQGSGRPSAAAQGRPRGLCRRAPAPDGVRHARASANQLARWRLDRQARDRRRPQEAYRHLRGACRIVAARPRGGQPLPDLPRTRRAAHPLRPRHGLHPYRDAADHRVSLRRLVGLSAGVAVRADKPVRHARGFRRLCGDGA